MSTKKDHNFKRTIYWLCITAVFMALNATMSSFGIPVPGGHLYMSDIIICTAAIIPDPLAAFTVGGVSTFWSDFFFYPLPRFVSLVTHCLQTVVGALDGLLRCPVLTEEAIKKALRKLFPACGNCSHCCGE